VIGPLLIALGAVCAFLLVQGMLRRGAIYEYPFLAGAVFAGFALPQLIGLSHDRFLPAGALVGTLIVAISSALMCWLGAKVALPPRQPSPWIYDDRRMLIVSAGLSLLGAYFYHAISRLPEEMTQNTQWTGLPVAYLFFARMLTYGFALSVLLFARNGSRLALIIALYGATFYLDRIVIGGRRQDTGEFFLMILLAWWFQRNRCIPRPLMLAGLILGALFVNSVGDYRALSSDSNGPKLNEVSNIDFLGNLSQLTEHGGPELTNAVYAIAGVDRTLEFDFGIYHWNQLVFAYVPAQLVGAELKSSLYLPLAVPAYEEFLYTPPLGSTQTGFSDAYQSFWYFGCLKFFLIAFVMQKLWWAARDGNLLAQLLYMLMPMAALEAITHTTQNFVGPWVHIGIFLLPAMLLTRRRRAEPTVAYESRRPAPAARSMVVPLARG
jgi:hypothetical protein